MKQVRLIKMLHVHKDRTDALSLIDVANDFINGLEYGLSIFGNSQETYKTNSGSCENKVHRSFILGFYNTFLIKGK